MLKQNASSLGGFKMTVLANYSDVVAYGLKSQKNAAIWHKVLKMIDKRRELEKQLIREFRASRPGMPPSSVIDKHSSYLEKSAPLPQYPIIVD